MNRTEIMGARHYDSPIGLLPSVTTILRATADMSGIEAWRERVGAAEADRILAEASERGTMLHMENEAFFMHGAPGNSTWWKTLEPVVRQVERVEAFETPVWSEHGFAGSPDMVGHLGEFRCVIDWKTARSPRKREWVEDYILQCAAYSIAWEERFPAAPIDQLHVFIAAPERRQHFGCYVPREVEAAQQEFLRRLAQYKTKEQEQWKNEAHPF